MKVKGFREDTSRSGRGSAPAPRENLDNSNEKCTSYLALRAIDRVTLTFSGMRPHCYAAQTAANGDY